MSNYEVGQELAPHTIIAHNYAEASDNKMHSDGTAEDYGYKGGLVPGVGIYGYMTVPIVEALGEDWLAHGHMTGKFIKPIYHEEPVLVTATVAALDPLRISVNIVNQDDMLCAVGEASLPEAHPEVDLVKLPFKDMPDADSKLPAKIESLEDDHLLGSLKYTIDLENTQGEFADFLDEMRDPLALYKSDSPPLHPAVVVAQANQVIMGNINLGPWIHTASDVRHHALPQHGEEVSLQGIVAHSYEKRGHGIVVLNLVALGKEGRLLQHLSHTAIIDPAKAS
ncbi:MAG: hypothetical protein COA73_14425 [Candidatus Hydrogenedentota bacterium]|nr:MAG: hypothetical protein COA73_14425 [Candidatus Hydrogenedentota bacterium]